MIRILDLPYREARALLSQGAPVYVPVNPVEYHGPHLSLHNDRLITHGYVPALHEAAYGARKPCLVADDLELGVEPCPGPGSRHTTFKAARIALEEATRALVEIGATKLVFVTFHGSPLHNRVLDEAIASARALGARAVAPFHAVLHAMVETQDGASFASTVAHVDDAEQRRRLLEALPLDFHAGFFETSVALHYAPASVSAIHKTLPPCPPLVPDARLAMIRRLAARFGREALARELQFAAFAAAWSAQRPFYGYTSEPSAATAEAGREFATAMIATMAPLVTRVLEYGEPPPETILKWLVELTLEGRIATATATADDVKTFD